MGMIPPQCIIHVKAYLTIMYFFFFLFCIRSVTTLQPYSEHQNVNSPPTIARR